MREIDIYVVEASDCISDGYVNKFAYTDYETAKKVVDELNRVYDMVTEARRVLDEEHAIDEFDAQEMVFVAHLKTIGREDFLDKYKNIPDSIQAMSSEDVDVLDQYDVELEEFVRDSSDDDYRSCARKCGYKDDVIDLLVKCRAYFNTVILQRYFVSSTPIKLVCES